MLITVHLNTDNLHCHFVVNSVFFKDGSKFGNHQKDHIRLREISDQVCREHGISVLENSSFWKGQSRGAYWYKKQGGMTHRDMLRLDIEYVLPTCGSRQDFKYQMEALDYSREVLDERINVNCNQGEEFYMILRGRIEKWRTTALKDEAS